MAKRILLGKAGSSDHGLFVSKTGVDVVNGSNVLTSSTNLMFDSRVGVGALDLKYHGQGLLGVPGNNLATATNLNTSDTFATITHSLGFVPFVIVQWCLQSDLSSGVATKMYQASADFNSDSTRFSSTGGQGTTQQRLARAGVSYTVNSSSLIIKNNMIGELYISKSGTLGQTFSETSRSYVGGKSIAYAFLIFDLEGG
jgi:hypothetical protein|tara:strand:+ start:147 stop:743 length:597 start_codon:yes stop_codon:yes gene_type:complete